MAGRPPKYETAEQLEKAILDYLDPDGVTPQDSHVIYVTTPNPTITGLALYLGFESRQSIYDYEQNGEFSYTVKKARLAIESKYEEKLYSQACTGAIFALKNFGWTDKQQLVHTGDPEAPVYFKIDPRFDCND